MGLALKMNRVYSGGWYLRKRLYFLFNVDYRRIFRRIRNINSSGNLNLGKLGHHAGNSWQHIIYYIRLNTEMTRCRKFCRVKLMDKATIAASRTHFFFRDFIKIVTFAIVNIWRWVFLIYNTFLTFFKFWRWGSSLFCCAWIREHSTAGYIDFTLASFLRYRTYNRFLPIGTTYSLLFRRRRSHNDIIFLAL